MANPKASPKKKPGGIRNIGAPNFGALYLCLAVAVGLFAGLLMAVLTKTHAGIGLSIGMGLGLLVGAVIENILRRR